MRSCAAIREGDALIQTIGALRRPQITAPVRPEVRHVSSL